MSRCATCGGDGVVMRWTDTSGLFPVKRETKPIEVPVAVKDAKAADCPTCKAQPKRSDCY